MPVVGAAAFRSDLSAKLRGSGIPGRMERSESVAGNADRSGVRRAARTATTTITGTQWWLVTGRIEEMEATRRRRTVRLTGIRRTDSA